MSKLFQGLTLLVNKNGDFVWATFDEIDDYIEKGYSLVNDLKKAAWDRNAK